jgi:hypothetical protein
MQILHAVQMGQSQNGAAGNLFRWFSRLASGNFITSTIDIVGTTNPPQSIASRWIRYGSNNLLTTTTSQILAFTVQKMLFLRLGLGFVMTELNG